MTLCRYGFGAAGSSSASKKGAALEAPLPAVLQRKPSPQLRPPYSCPQPSIMYRASAHRVEAESATGAGHRVNQSQLECCYSIGHKTSAGSTMGRRRLPHLDWWRTPRP